MDRINPTPLTKEEEKLIEEANEAKKRLMDQRSWPESTVTRLQKQLPQQDVEMAQRLRTRDKELAGQP